VFEQTSPQQYNGYTYAADNPVTNSDPTGLYLYLCGSSGCGSPQYFIHQQLLAEQAQQQQQQQYIRLYDVLATTVESHAIDACAYRGGCIRQVLTNFKNPQYTLNQVSQYIAAEQYQAQQASLAAAQLARQRAQHSSSGWLTSLLVAGGIVLTVVNVAQFGADPATDTLEAADIGGLTADVTATGADAAATAAANESAAAEADMQAVQTDEQAVKAEEAATCGGQSFTAGTKVLLASGLAVPIASLKPGEKVLATNVKTGKTQAEPITAVLVHHDTNLYNLTIKTSHGTAIIRTTSSHLFYDLTQHTWVKARALHRGDSLQAPVSTTTTVVGGSDARHASGWMWDLSVPGGGDHDFYVQTVNAAVLVHNCGYTPAGRATDFSREEIAQLTYQHIGAGDIAGRPSLEEIQAVLDRGQPVQLPGQDAVQLEYGGVRVIVNENMPWRSTAYYPGS
jgi:hypothetical protein